MSKSGAMTVDLRSDTVTQPTPAMRAAMLAAGLCRLRFVTHLDLDAAGIDHAVAVMRDFLSTDLRVWSRLTQS